MRHIRTTSALQFCVNARCPVSILVVRPSPIRDGAWSIGHGPRLSTAVTVVSAVPICPSCGETLGT